MALSPSGQWLVEAGMRMLSRTDQATWQEWVRQAGWSPNNREPKRVPPHIAVLAAKALEALMDVLTADIRERRVAGDDEIDNLNDIDAAKAARASLEMDIRQI
jgi:hypothetical protein